MDEPPDTYISGLVRWAMGAPRRGSLGVVAGPVAPSAAAASEAPS